MNETREKGGIPVLFNSIVRRNFGVADDKVVAQAIIQDDILRGLIRMQSVMHRRPLFRRKGIN